MGRAGTCAFETERSERSQSTRGASRDARPRPSRRAREAQGCCHGQSVRTAAVPRATEEDSITGTVPSLHYCWSGVWHICTPTRAAARKRRTCGYAHASTALHWSCIEGSFHGGVIMSYCQRACSKTSPRTPHTRSRQCLRGRCAQPRRAAGTGTVLRPSVKSSGRRVSKRSISHAERDRASGSEDGEKGAVAKETYSPRLPTSPPHPGGRAYTNRGRSEKKGKKEAKRAGARETHLLRTIPVVPDEDRPVAVPAREERVRCRPARVPGP